MSVSILYNIQQKRKGQKYVNKFLRESFADIKGRRYKENSNQ